MDTFVSPTKAGNPFSSCSTPVVKNISTLSSYSVPPRSAMKQPRQPGELSSFKHRNPELAVFRSAVIFRPEVVSGTRLIDTHEPDGMELLFESNKAYVWHCFVNTRFAMSDEPLFVVLFL